MRGHDSKPVSNQTGSVIIIKKERITVLQEISILCSKKFTCLKQMWDFILQALKARESNLQNQEMISVGRFKLCHVSI